MAQPIEFYFDFSSPYGYFARHAVEIVGSRIGRAITWRPIMIGSAFKASGNLPLVAQPLKGDYSKRDWERLARLYQVDWVLPDPFPIATLAAARAFYAIDASDPDLAKKFAAAIYDAYFGRGINIGPAEAAAEIAHSIGLDGDVVLKANDDPAMKQRLKDETSKAIERGVFGSPFFFVDGEPFWGWDRMPLMEEWVKRGGW
jgi:2-hydroxychromene-2-carboxylate isomerase